MNSKRIYIIEFYVQIIKIPIFVYFDYLTREKIYWSYYYDYMGAALYTGASQAHIFWQF